MNFVQPIREIEKIEEFKSLLKERSQRDYFLFFMGINTGLRISDLLPLKVKDVKNKTHITITEEKTDHFYQKYKDLALLQELFNHSAPSVTLRYIGINQDMIDDAMREFKL